MRCLRDFSFCVVFTWSLRQDTFRALSGRYFQKTSGRDYPLPVLRLDRLSARFQHIREYAHRLSVRLRETVQILLRSIDLRVSEPLLYLADVDTAIQQERCRCVPQAVELSVLQSVLFEELIKLFCRGLMVHDLAVPLCEQPFITLPFAAETLFFAFIVRFKHFDQLYAVPVDRYRPDLIVLRRFYQYRLISQFYCSSCDRQLTFIVIGLACSGSITSSLPTLLYPRIFPLP